MRCTCGGTYGRSNFRRRSGGRGSWWFHRRRRRRRKNVERMPLGWEGRLVGLGAAVPHEAEEFAMSLTAMGPQKIAEALYTSKNVHVAVSSPAELTDEHVRQYRELGFVAVNNVFTAEEIATAK